MEVVDADVHSESISTSVDENQDNQCTEVADNNHTTEINVCDDAIVDMTDEFATSLCRNVKQSCARPSFINFVIVFFNCFRSVSRIFNLLERTNK